MTKINLDDLLDEAQSRAEDMLRRHGRIFPLVLYIAADGNETNVVPYGPPSKPIHVQVLARLIGNMIRKRGAVAYAVASEISVGSPYPNRERHVGIQAHDAISRQTRFYVIQRATRSHRLIRYNGFYEVTWEHGDAWDNLLVDPSTTH